MTSVPTRFRGLAYWLLLVGQALCLGTLASAVTTGVPTLPGYAAPGYVVNADRTVDTPAYTTLYKRWYLPAEGTVSIPATVSASTSYYRIAFRITESGVPVALQGDDADGYVYDSWQSFAGPTLVSTTLTFSLNLIPDASTVFDQNKVYKLQAKRQEWTGLAWVDAGTPVTSPVSYTFVHFTGPFGTDTALNVVARSNSATWVKRYAVATDAGNTQFTVSSNFDLYRYDEPHLGGLGASDLVHYKLTYRLYDTAAPLTPIATASTVLSGFWSLPRYNANALGPTTPATINLTRTLTLIPAAGVQLDSPKANYRVEVELSHLEQPSSLVYLADSSDTTVSTQLQHFNGTLYFGSGAELITATMASVTNDPTIGAVDAGVTITTSLTVPAGSASIDGAAGYTFGGIFPVSLRSDGIAVCTGAGTYAVTPPGLPDRTDHHGLRFYRTNLELSHLGLTADLRLILPSGLGWSSTGNSKLLSGELSFPATYLAQALVPSANLTYTPVGSLWLTEESKPLAFQAASVHWTLSTGILSVTPAAANGVYYHRTTEYNNLAAAVDAPANERYKLSNEQYLRSVATLDGTVTITPDARRTAQLGAKLVLGNGSFRSHFPYAAFISWGNGGHVLIDRDKIVPSQSHLLTFANNVSVSMSYGADCNQSTCGDAPGAGFSLLPDNQSITITEDGGLVAPGVLTAVVDLHWGYIASHNAYAHTLKSLAEGTFMMAGHFLRGADYTVLATQAPGGILFSGVDAASGVLSDRPWKGGYYTGLGDYAGMNFRCGPNNSAASAFLGVSTLAGDPYGVYQLKNRSKYYVRRGGVTGIHDAATAPPTAHFYGYDVALSHFGLNFRDNENLESRTQGSIHVAFPSNLTQTFEELTFWCNGALRNAKVPYGASANALQYWNAPIDVLSIAFARKPGMECDPGDGYLTLGVAGYISHVRETLYGTLGFLANGNLIPQAFGIPGLDSRLKMPPLTRIRGPKRQAASGFEDYLITPVSDAYFNVPGSGAPDFAPGALVPGAGFVTFAGLVKVPYFEALHVQFQTSSNRVPADPDGAPGVWGEAPLHVRCGSWNGTGYFDGGYFDEINRGFPISVNGAAMTNESYLASPDFRVRAKQGWLGGQVVYDYPLVWNTTTRSFRSPEPVSNDFVLVNMQHRVKYLSAERQEVAFGPQYDGLPEVNLSNFVINEANDTTGTAKASLDALGSGIVLDIEAGIAALDELLDDDPGGFYDAVFAAVLDGQNEFLDDLYSDLVASWSATGWVAGEPASRLATRFAPGGGAGSLAGVVFAKLSNGAGTDQIDEIVLRLRAAKDAIVQLRSVATGNGPNGRHARELALTLIQQQAVKVNANLASMLGGDAAAQITAKLDPLIAEVDPSLKQIDGALAELWNSFQAVEDSLTGANGATADFLGQMQALYNGSVGQAKEFGVLSTTVSDGLGGPLGYLQTFGAGKQNFLAISKEDVKKRLRREIMDRFVSSAYVSNVRAVFKHRVQDLYRSFTTAGDSVFGQVNLAVQGVVSQALAEIDTSSLGLLGDIKDYLGAGKIDGHAHFQGYALRKIRVDGDFTLDLPEETTIHAYTEINQQGSEGDVPACMKGAAPNTLFTEVVIGADDVECGFLGLDISVDVQVKLSFKSLSTDAWSLRPIGVAGAFNLAGGTIDFEAFKITDLSAGVAFGEFENYITASLGMQIGSWGAKGGIFFGRTCTIDPIKLWDPFAAEALGDPNPTFTGGYVYGEAHIPVSEVVLGIPSSCLFEISADAGLGIFYFLEGPTYGGRFGLGVDGELLCLLSVGGRIDMIGFKQGDAFHLKGKGKVYAEVGWCDFCVEVSKTIEMETTVGADGGMNGDQSSN